VRKYLRVQMSDGLMYDIPAEIIAEHRASFFESNSADKLTYHASSVQPRLHGAEKEFALNNDNIMLDWATNKIKWEDVKEHAIRVQSDSDSYDKDWETAPKKIIEH